MNSFQPSALELPDGFFDVQQRLKTENVQSNERSFLEKLMSSLELIEDDKLIGVYARKVDESRYDGITIIEYRYNNKLESDFLYSVYEHNRSTLHKAGVVIEPVRIYPHLSFKRFDIYLPNDSGRTSMLSYLAKKTQSKTITVVTLAAVNTLAEDYTAFLEKLDL